MNKLVILFIVAGIALFFVGLGIWLTPDDKADKILSLDPKKAIDFECTPETNPPGTKIKIVSTNGTIIQSWRFDCDMLALVIETVDRIDREYCVAGSTRFNGSQAGFSGVEIKFENSSVPKGIRLSTPEGSFLFPCGKWVDELKIKLAEAFTSCCN